MPHQHLSPQKTESRVTVTLNWVLFSFLCFPVKETEKHSDPDPEEVREVRDYRSNKQKSLDAFKKRQASEREAAEQRRSARAATIAAQEQQRLQALAARPAPLPPQVRQTVEVLETERSQKFRESLIKTRLRDERLAQEKKLAEEAAAKALAAKKEAEEQMAARNAIKKEMPKQVVPVLSKPIAKKKSKYADVQVTSDLDAYLDTPEPVKEFVVVPDVRAELMLAEATKYDYVPDEFDELIEQAPATKTVAIVESEIAVPSTMTAPSIALYTVPEVTAAEANYNRFSPLPVEELPASIEPEVSTAADKTLHRDIKINPNGKNRRERRAQQVYVDYDPLDEAIDELERKVDYINDQAQVAETLVKAKVVFGAKNNRLRMKKAARTVDTTAVEPAATMIARTGDKYGFTGFMLRDGQTGEVGSGVGFSKLSHQGYPTTQVLSHTNVTLTVEREGKPDPSWYSNWIQDPELSNMFVQWLYEETAYPYHFKWTEDAFKKDSHLSKVLHPAPRQVSLEPGRYRWKVLEIGTDGKTKTTRYFDYHSDRDEIEVNGIILSREKVPFKSLAFDDLTRTILRRLKEIDPNYVMPNEESVARSPTVFYSVVKVVKDLRLRTDIPSLLRYIGIAVQRTIDSAKSYYIKHGMNLHDYRREYNKMFGKVANTRQMKTLVEDAVAAGGSENQIRRDVIANIAAQNMNKVARQLGSNSRGRKHQQAGRDKKYEDSPQSGRIASAVSAGFNAVVDVGSAGIGMVKELFSSIWSMISNFVKGIVEDKIIVYQMRIISLCKLFVAFSNLSVYGIVSEIVSCVLAWFPITAIPEFVSRLVSKVTEAKADDEPERDTSTNYFEVDGESVSMKKENFAVFSELVSQVKWRDGFDETTQTLISEEEFTEDVATRTFHKYVGLQKYDMIQYHAYVAAKLLWKNCAMFDGMAPQNGFPFKSVMCSLPFVELIIELLGCKNIGEVNTSLAGLKKLAETITTLSRGAMTVADMFKAVITSIFTNGFGYDPFDSKKTLATASITSATSFLQAFQPANNTKQLEDQVKRFEMCGSLITLPLNTLVSNSLCTVFTQAYISKMSEYFTAKRGLENPKPRTPPLGILFAGTASKGKTIASMNLVRLLLPLINRDKNGGPTPYHSNQTFQIPNANNWFFDGVKQSQEHFNDDEFLTVQDSNGQIVTAMSAFLTKFVSSQRCMLDMAFTGKGKFTANAKLFTACTNLSNPEPKLFPVPDPTAIGRRFRVFVAVEDQKTDEQGRPFWHQTFCVSGDYLLEWAGLNGVQVYKGQDFIWHAIRFPQTNPTCYVKIPGHQLLDFCVYTYSRHVKETDHAILKDEDLKEFSAELEKKYGKTLEQFVETQQLPTDHIEIKPLTRTEYFDITNAAYRSVQKEQGTFLDALMKKYEDSPQMGAPGASHMAILQEASELFEVKLPTPRDIVDSIVSTVKDNWVACIVAGLLLGGALFYRYVSSSSMSPQSPNVQHAGKVTNRGKNPHVHHATYTRKGVHQDMSPPKASKTMRPQMGHDSVDNRVARELSMSRALVRVRLYVVNDEEDLHIIESRGIFINAHNILIPGHFDIFGRIMTIDVTDFKMKYEGITPLGVISDPSHDLALLVLDGRSSRGLCPHASANGMFWHRTNDSALPRSDSYFEEKSLRYYVYTPETRNLHVTDVYVSSVGTSDYDVITPIEKEWSIPGTLKFKRGFEDGACGTMYGIEERGTMYFCGFHICGSKSKGSAAIVDDEYVEWFNDVAASTYKNCEGAKYSEPPNHLVPDGSGLPTFNDLPIPEEDENGNMRPINGAAFKVPQEWFELMDHYPKLGVATVQAPLVRGTKYTATPFLGDLPAEPDCVPLNMYPHKMDNGERVDPVARALKKRILNQPKDIELPDRDVFREWWYAEQPPEKVKPYTLDESLNGDSEEGMPSAAANTTAGYGYKFPGKSAKRFHMQILENGRRALIPETQKLFDNCHNMARAGKRFQSVFTDTCKDETLPLKHKLRLFKCGSMPLTLLQRMYYGRFVNAMQRYAYSHFGSIGVNASNPNEWKGLLQDALKGNAEGEGFSNDYEAYDTSLLRELLHFAFQEVIAWINPDPEDLPAYWVLAWQIINPICIIFGLLYEGQGGPSGHALTSWINTIVNMYMLLCTWLALARAAGFMFPDTKKFRPKAYGDDNINFSVRYNGVLLDWSRAQDFLYTTFGVKTSDSDKYSGLNGFIMKKWQDMTYLSRGFVVRYGMLQAPLPIRRIASTFSYMSSKDRTTVQAICDSMALELTHFPKETFNEWRDAVLGHPWAKELKLEFWTWEHANGVRHGFHIDVSKQDGDDPMHPMSLKIEPCALKHGQHSRTYGDSKVIGIPTESGSIDYTQNLVSFGGVGERVEQTPLDVEMPTGIPGFKTTFPAQERRPVLIYKGTVSAASPTDTVVTTLHMPQDVINQPMYANVFKSARVSYKRVCFWIETVKPALASCSLYVTGGANNVISGAGPGQEINHCQVVVEDDMNQETCISLPYNHWYPVMTLSQMQDITGGPDVPGSTWKVRVLTPLRAGLTSITQTMDVRIWAYIEGLETHTADPWNGTVAHELRMRPQSSEQKATEGQTGLSHGNPSVGITPLYVTPPKASAFVNSAAAVTGQVATELAGAADALKELGLSTPPDQTSAVRMTQTYNVPQQDQARDTHVFTAKKHQQMPDVCLGSTENYTDLVKMAKRPMIIFNLPVATGTKYYIPVCNKYYKYGTSPTAGTFTCHPSGALYASMLGNSSFGGTNFMMKLVVPGACEGVIQISWIAMDYQTFTTAPAFLDPSNIYKQDIRFTGSTDIKFRIPHMNPLPNFGAVPHSMYNDTSGLCDNGTLIIEITSLVSSTLTSPGLDLVVWAAADSTFRVFGPQLPFVTNNDDPPVPYNLDPYNGSGVHAIGKDGKSGIPVASAGAGARRKKHMMKPQMMPLMEFQSDFPVLHPAMGNGLSIGDYLCAGEELKSVNDLLRYPTYASGLTLPSASNTFICSSQSNLVAVTGGTTAQQSSLVAAIIACWARCRGGLQVHLRADSNGKNIIQRRLSTTGLPSGDAITDLTPPVVIDFDIKPWHTFDFPLYGWAPFVKTSVGNWTGSSYLTVRSGTVDIALDVYANVSDDFRLAQFIGPPEVVTFKDFTL